MPTNTQAVSIRPVTSKARGICKYYVTPRGCYAGAMCKFLHGVPRPKEEHEQPLLTPYDKAKRCKYFDQGFCKRGDKCWFLHKLDQQKVSQPDEDDESCSVCFEQPAMYGLLDGCSHVFCISCLKQWRDPQNKAAGVLESGNTKKCPMCRTSSRFITPSSKFWKEGTEEKKKATQAYMESMAKVSCRYFQTSLSKNSNNPICPYGKDCFYRHVKPDGTPYVFKEGVEVCMSKYRRAARRGASVDDRSFPWAIAESLLHPFIFDVERAAFAPNNDDNVPPPSSDTQTDQIAFTPSIHQQHNSGRDGERRMRHLIRQGLLRMMMETGQPEHIDGVEQEHPENFLEQGINDEDTAMETLQMMADEILASIDELRVGVAAGRTPSESLENIPTAATEHQSDDESEGDMPGLESVLSDSEEGDSDSDEDNTADGLSDRHEDVGDDGGDLPETIRDLLERATGSDGRFISTLVVQQEEEMPELEPVVQSDIRRLTQDSTSTILQPTSETCTTSRGASKNTRPSDAFTTDGRGRVISVGATGSAGPGPGGSETCPPQPEASTATPSQPEQGRPVERRGFLDWIGSFI